MQTSLSFRKGLLLKLEDNSENSKQGNNIEVLQIILNIVNICRKITTCYHKLHVNIKLGILRQRQT